MSKFVFVYEFYLGFWLYIVYDELVKILYGEGVLVEVFEWNIGVRFLIYYELVDKLIFYVKELGYIYIELLSIVEYFFDGFWGY